jgi:hypothetical protein
MAEFTANLNPTNNQSNLVDLLRTRYYMNPSKAAKVTPKAVTATPAADVVLAKPPISDNWMDSGDSMPFTFGAGYQK